MRITLKYKRGDRVYNIRSAWDKKERKYILKVRCTKFVGYLIYPEEKARIYYKCVASESWIEIENLYPTSKKALAAIKRGEGERCCWTKMKFKS
jgi:hypothetical protein